MKIIAFEGASGSGKSSLIKALKKKLEMLGYTAIVAAEPRLPYKYVRKSTKKSYYLHHRKKIFNEIYKCNPQFVLCDRNLSTMVVHNLDKINKKTYLETVAENKAAMGGRKIDLEILLCASYETCHKSRRKLSKKEYEEITASYEVADRFRKKEQIMKQVMLWRTEAGTIDTGVSILIDDFKTRGWLNEKTIAS